MSIIVNDQEIDWQKWLELEVTDESDFRDNHLLKQDYHENFDELVNGLYSVTDGFSDYKNEKKFGGYIASGRRRIIDALDLMSLQYSAGGDVGFIKELYPYLLHWMEEYAETSHLYNLSPDAGGRYVWHISLGTEDYWYVALRLIYAIAYIVNLPTLRSIIWALSMACCFMLFYLAVKMAF